MLSTKSKIKIAHLLNIAVVGARSLMGQTAIVDVRRGGVNWHLDLNEGIDLAIYLGLYQRIPRRVVETWIRPGALALDIGANIGSHALLLARQVGPQGRLVAVEPTDYAFAKLSANASLNPDLDKQLIRVQAAISDASSSGNGATEPAKFYSSWPLGGDPAGRHAKHLGQLQSAEGARFVALDTLLGELRANGSISGAVKFVKLDVDGHELGVLRSGQQMFQQDRPAILVEIAPAAQDEVQGRFEALIDTLMTFGYRLQGAELGESLPMSAPGLRKIIKAGASVDALALPS